jgi:hypothetical protein
MNDFPEGTIYIEIQGLYDGWSIAKLPDGTLINRWDTIKNPQRHIAIEKIIKMEVKNED